MPSLYDVCYSFAKEQAVRVGKLLDYFQVELLLQIIRNAFDYRIMCFYNTVSQRSIVVKKLYLSTIDIHLDKIMWSIKVRGAKLAINAFDSVLKTFCIFY